MAGDDQEKTEQPTSRRREQARSEGNLAVSKEVGTLFVIGGAVLVMYFGSTWMVTGITSFMKTTFTSNLARTLTPEDVTDISWVVSRELLLILAPFMAIPVFGVAAYLVQNGLTLTSKPLEPKFSKLDPIEGAKKLVSFNSLSELVKSLLKIGVLAWVSYTTVAAEWESLPMLLDMEVKSSIIYMGEVTFTIMTRTIWVLLVIAAIDFVFQRWNHERGLKMSRQEVKDEHKQTEGDPMVKARIKSLQREAAQKRMMHEVPDADVVVTNPVHLAVAIKYDQEKGGAPRVVAKGAGKVAEKIKEIAREHGVPVLEDKPLARGLFRTVELGSEIPVEMYKAVAEILAYVYRLKNRIRPQ